MKQLSLFFLLFVLLLGCQPDVPVCTTLCATVAACHDISNPEAAQEAERYCLSSCSHNSTYGSWDMECGSVNSDGFCNDWDTDRDASAESWAQYYRCWLDFAECHGVEYRLSDDDFDSCIDYLQ